MIFRVLLLLAIFQISIFGNSVYNPNILDFQAKVFPKIVALDNKIENKLVDNSIVFTILYEDIDLNTAQILKDKIEKNYTNLKNYKLEVKLQEYNSFVEYDLSTAYCFLLGKKEVILEISTVLSKNSRLSFAYNYDYLDFGVIFGLKIGQKVDIFLKFENLKKSKIELQNSIFNLVNLR